MFSKSYTTKKWKSWNFNPGALASKVSLTTVNSPRTSDNALNLNKSNTTWPTVDIKN